MKLIIHTYNPAPADWNISEPMIEEWTNEDDAEIMLGYYERSCPNVKAVEIID